MGDQPSEFSDAEWRERLSPEAYHVLREAGTEPAFTGAYVNHKKPGVYCCGGCHAELFTSTTKYDSGSGWPSFTEPIAEGVVVERPDDSFGQQRTEVLCATCHGHLGHVFDDGPAENGLRYCMNSLSLDFDAE